MTNTQAPKPPGQRRRRNKPTRGEWKAPPGIGWQHGPFPEPPSGVLRATRDAWRTWMTSWVAAFWEPGNLPQLRVVALLYDAVERGKYARAPELRMWLDGAGITQKGQQDRRWLPPTEDDAPAARTSSTLPRPRILATLPRLRAGSEE